MLSEQCLPPYLEVEPSLLEWTPLLLLSAFALLSPPSLKPDCCDSCAPLTPSISSSKDSKFSSFSTPLLLRLPLRSSSFEGAEAVIEGLQKAKTANVTSGVQFSAIEIHCMLVG